MGRTYVMSDIHGMAELLERMLRKIAFSPEDTLYILGDMIDRGPDPAGVLELAASRENIVDVYKRHSRPLHYLIKHPSVVLSLCIFPPVFIIIYIGAFAEFIEFTAHADLVSFFIYDSQIYSSSA